MFGMFKMEGPMRNRFYFTFLIIAGLLLGTTSSSAAPGATPLGTDFTYQGHLERDGSPYTGTCDFQFSLWDAESGGGQDDTIVTLNGLAVTDGQFTAILDFGPGAFNGDARWLELVVQCPEDSGLTTFPRQELTAAPYALYAATAPWSGLSGVPGGFSDDVDNDSTYLAGNGLMLSTNTFSIDSSYTQRRVGENCSVGSVIHSINEDGSVICHADLPGRDTFHIATLAPTVAFDISSTTGTDGLGLISYYDYFYLNEQLMVAHCNDIACTTAMTSIVDSDGSVGLYSSIIIGADGLGLISYYDIDNGNLKVAHCNNIECSSATAYILDETGDVGKFTSISIGVDGLGLISYQDVTNKNLKVAHCDDINCSSATISTADSSGTMNFYTAITIGGDGLGLISYMTSVLKVAYCADLLCSTATLNTVDSSGVGGYFTSITTGADGLGLISYNMMTGALKIAHCENADCSSATTYSLDSAVSLTEQDTSITIGTDGLGLISYYDNPKGDLKVAHCNDIACSSANIITVDSSGDVGRFTMINIGGDGLPRISFIDTTHNTLNVLHCSNTLCIPYFRIR
jgi:hypothetical protein